MSTVVIAGGGTGGHLFPGLAVAEELRRRGVGVEWLGARRGIETTRVPAAGIPLHTVNVHGAVGMSLVARATAVARLPLAVAQAIRLFLRCRARAVLAVGGYASLPGAIAAAMLGIPLVLQEQNAIPGLTTRLAAPFSEAIACGFAAAVERFPSLPAVWTGNPVRPEFFAVPAPDRTAPSVLVLGGSQGSAFLNRVVPEAIARLERRPPVLHQSGPRWADEVVQRYRDLGVEARVEPFVEDPARALAAATVVVARAGALTVTEIAAAGRSAVLVPFAAAAHGHQLHNARALAAYGTAAVVEEHRASPEALAAAVADALSKPAPAVAPSGLARASAAADVARLVVERMGGAA